MANGKKGEATKGRDKKGRGTQGPESSQDSSNFNPPVPGRKPILPLQQLDFPPVQGVTQSTTGGTRPPRQPADEDGDPTRVTGIGLLDEIDEFFQQTQVPSTTLRERRQAELVKREGDERIPLLGRTRPPEEEEPPIVPGDPDDLGARARRRHRQDDSSSSPVLRRGLLGV